MRSTSLISPQTLRCIGWFAVCRWAVAYLAAAGLLAACQAPKPATVLPPDIAVLPANAFGQVAIEHKSKPVSIEKIETSTATQRRRTQLQPALIDDGDAWIYTSQVSQSHLMSKGIDPTTATRMWGNVLRSKGLLVGRITMPEEVDRLNPRGLLVLPQMAHLNPAEREALRRWMQRGGSLLTSHETGTLGQGHQSSPDEFMARALGVAPARGQAVSTDASYLVPVTDFGVLHTQPTGLRIWMERSSKLPFVPLQGDAPLAFQSDWPRTPMANGYPGPGMIMAAERPAKEGKTARIVVLGYAEQSWQRMNPDHFNHLHGDLVDWLLRVPRASLGNWPGTYTSASAVALPTPASANPSLRDFHLELKAAGIAVSCYRMPPPGAPSDSETPPPCLDANLQWISGNSTQYLQPSKLINVNTKTAVKSEFFRAASTWNATPHTGTTAPVRYAVVSMEGDDTVLPFVLDSGDERTRWIGMSLSIVGLDKRMEQADKALGFRQYLQQIAYHQRIGGLALVWMLPGDAPNASQRGQLLNQLRRNSSSTDWLTTTADIARWWDLRSDIDVSTHTQDQVTTLAITTPQELSHPLGFPVWVSLPFKGARMSVTGDATAPQPRLANTDDRKALLVWDRLPAGTTRWSLRFDKAR